MAKNGKKELVAMLVELSSTEEFKQKSGTKKLTIKAAGAMVDLFTEAIHNLVVTDGDSIAINNLVKIEKYEAAATQRRHPQTGEMMSIPAKVRTRAKARF